MITEEEPPAEKEPPKFEMVVDRSAGCSQVKLWGKMVPHLNEAVLRLRAGDASRLELYVGGTTAEIAGQVGEILLMGQRIYTLRELEEEVERRLRAAKEKAPHDVLGAGG